ADDARGGTPGAPRTGGRPSPPSPPSSRAPAAPPGRPRPGCGAGDRPRREPDASRRRPSLGTGGVRGPVPGRPRTRRGRCRTSSPRGGPGAPGGSRRGAGPEPGAARRGGRGPRGALPGGGRSPGGGTFADVPRAGGGGHVVSRWRARRPAGGPPLPVELVRPVRVPGILAALVVPLPPWLLDFGLAVNLLAAASLLLAALQARTALELSAFPTLLLVTTLLRLALNVSSTRLALAEGHAG